MVHGGRYHSNLEIYKKRKKTYLTEKLYNEYIIFNVRKLSVLISLSKIHKEAKFKIINKHNYHSSHHKECKL